MARYPLGQPVTIPITVQQRNADGTYSLVDPGTLTTVVNLAAADGTTTTTGTYTSPAHDSTGKYHQDIPAADLATLGHYQWAVTTTGAGAGVTYGEFEVFDPFEVAIVSLGDAKQQLHIDPADTSDDDELRDYLSAITASVEEYKHEVIARRTITDELEIPYLSRRFRVWSAPVISVTSAVSWDGLTTYDTTTWQVSRSGLVRIPVGPMPYGLVNVTYLAGYTVVPGNYRRGTLVMLQHVWETQRGVGTAGSGVIGPEEHFRQPGEWFTVPAKAKEWLGPPVPVVA